MKLCAPPVGLCLVLLAAARLAGGESPPLRDQAAQALRKAVAFYDRQISVEGGYLWRYAADLSAREGEREASSHTAWVQPPGTPTVGMALLNAYRRCQERPLLDAARRTASALVQGQLESGGWDYLIQFDPTERKRYAYRVAGSNPGARNTTTLDDNTTQSALQFLMELDLELEFADRDLHEAVVYALDRLIAAQYPNGAWAQRFSAPPDAEKFPVKQASFPKSWAKEYPGDKYFDHYTFNDNSLADVIQTLFLAAEIYDVDRYRRAALRGADFILLAQLPEPQPAWAQQYNTDMHPSWARRFEPPSVTGGESQGIMRLLLTIYRETGDKKYLQPIPPALLYLRRSLLPNGQLARFYELRTNRPLYFVRDTYELTYDDGNLPTHYGFKVSSKLDAIEAEYERVLALPPDALKQPARRPAPAQERASSSLEGQARHVIAALDERGAWVEPGQLRHAKQEGVTRIVDMQTFAKNIEVLSRYLGSKPPQ